MPSDSFPWRRYQAAERYLYAVKPYWSRFGSRFKVVPMDVPAPPGQAFGAMTSTDEAFNLYVDGAFARNAPIEVIAGAIEHELRYHVQDYFGRMAFADRDRASKYKKLSFELEVNETIEAETSRITPAAINRALHDSMVFSHAEYRQLGIQGPPSISDLAWTPERMGMAAGHTAEEYFSELRRAMRQEEMEQSKGYPEDDQDGEETSPDDGQDDQTEQDELEGEPDLPEEADGGDSGDSGSSPSDDLVDDLLFDDDGEPPEQGDGQDDTGDESAPEDPDQDGDDPLDQSQTSSSGDTDGEVQKAEADPEDGESSSGDEEGDIEEDRPDGPESDSSDPQPDTDMTDSDESPLDKMKDIIDDVPSMSWWTRDVDPEGFIDEDQDVSQDSPSEWEEREWLEELAQDVKEAQQSSAFGLEPGNALVEICGDILQSAAGNTYEELRRAISSSVNTTQIKGSSDTSYQVRNPNQPSIGVVLMGSYSYSPCISVILDVSMSMMPVLERSLITLRDLIRSAVGMYGDQVNWLAVDSDVVDMGKASRVDMKLVRRIARGYGGTVLGPTMQDLANGTFVKGRNRLPRQDLVVVITDCGFSWPWKEGRPPSKTTFMVVHPESADLDRINLPEWVHQRPHMLVPMPL